MVFCHFGVVHVGRLFKLRGRHEGPVRTAWAVWADRKLAPRDFREIIEKKCLHQIYAKYNHVSNSWLPFFSKLNNETSRGNQLHFSGLPGRKIAPLELRALESPRSQQKFCRPIGQTKPPAALGCLPWLLLGYLAWSAAPVDKWN